MLTRLLSALLLVGTASPAMADHSHVACWIEQGEAKISLCNANGSSSKSGRLNYTAYDRNGRQTDSGWCIGIGIAILGCDEMCSESIDEDAVYCSASWDQ
jgi:hypothetical protein